MTQQEAASARFGRHPCHLWDLRTDEPGGDIGRLRAGQLARPAGTIGPPMTDRVRDSESPAEARIRELAPYALRRRGVLLAAGIIAVLYLGGVTNLWRPGPDSALYMSLGRSLARGEGYVFNGRPHAHVAPGLPLVLAGLRLAFGPEALWAPNLLMVLCGLGGLALVYAALGRLAGRAFAMPVVLLTAFAYPTYLLTHDVLTEAPFFLLFWALLYCLVRERDGRGRWLWLAGACGLAAVAVRLPGVLVLVPLAAGLALTGRAGRPGGARPAGTSWRKRRLVAAAAVLGPVVVPAAGFLVAVRLWTGRLPDYLGVTIANLTESFTKRFFLLDGLLAAPTSLAELLISQDGAGAAPLGCLAVALAGFGAAAVWRSEQRALPIAAFGTLLVLAFLGGHKAVVARYLLPVAPIWLYLILLGLADALRRPQPWRLRLGAWLAAVAAAAFLRVRPWYEPTAVLLGAVALVEVFLLLRRRFAARPGLPAAAVGVLTGLCVAVSAPRTLRDAVYYTYLVHTGQYYAKAHGGARRDFDTLAAHLRGLPGDAVVAMRGNKASIFHFLTDRRMVYLNRRPRTPADAEEFVRKLAARPGVRAVVLDTREGPPAYVARARELLSADSAWQRARDFQSDRYIVYRPAGRH